MNLIPPLDILCTEHTRQLSVHTASQYLVQHLDDSYLHSQAVEERSELHTDDTAADDGYRLRTLCKGEDTVRVQDCFMFCSPESG